MADEMAFNLPTKEENSEGNSLVTDLFGFSEFLGDTSQGDTEETNSQQGAEQNVEQQADITPTEKNNNKDTVEEEGRPEPEQQKTQDVQSLLAQQAQLFNQQIQGLNNQIQLLQQNIVQPQKQQDPVKYPKPEEFEDDPAGWTKKYIEAKEIAQKQVEEKKAQDQKARDIARRNVMEQSLNKAKQVLPVIDTDPAWGEAFKKVYFDQGFDKSYDGPLLAALSLKSMYLEQQSKQNKSKENEISKAVAQDRSRQQRVASQAMHGSGTNSKADAITLPPEIDAIRKNLGLNKEDYIRQFKNFGLDTGGTL
jgi:hypothetical protein